MSGGSSSPSGTSIADSDRIPGSHASQHDGDRGLLQGSLMASLAAAERDLARASDKTSESMDSEERDLALLAQQIEDEVADRRSNATGSSGGDKRKKRQVMTQLRRQAGDAPRSSSDSSASGLSGLQLQNLQNSLDKRSTSSQGSFGRSHEELWRLLQQQRKDMADLQEAMTVAEAKQKAEISSKREQLMQAQKRTQHTEEIVAEKVAEMEQIQYQKQDIKQELKAKLEKSKEVKAEVEDVKEDLADKIAAAEAKQAAAIEKLEREARLLEEKNEEMNRERIEVDAVQKQVQEAEIAMLKEKVEETKTVSKEVKQERDQLRRKAQMVAQKATEVPDLQQQVEEVKARLDAKLDQVAPPDAEEFKNVLDKLKEVKLREAEKLKQMAELKLQVQDIKSEKNATVGELQTQLNSAHAMMQNKQVEWCVIKNSYHDGHDLPGSGESYTMADAQAHALVVGAVCFTQDLWLTHRDGTDGVFWFHAELLESEKRVKYTGRPDGTQNLWWRSEGTPTAKVAPTKPGGSLVAPARQPSQPPNLFCISEDEDTLSEHGSIAASCNVSSIGEGEEGVADIHDFDDNKEVDDSVAFMTMEAKLAKDAEEQLKRERQEKDMMLEEMAARVAEQRSKLHRLESKVEYNQNYKEEAQETIQELRDCLHHKKKTKEAVLEDKEHEVEKKKELAKAKERRIMELKEKLSNMKEKYDRDCVEFAELRQHIAMARASKQLADTRIADYADAMKAMQVKQEETVARLKRDIAKLQDPQASPDNLGEEEVLVKAKADTDVIEGLRDQVQNLKSEISEQQALLQRKEQENVAERETLEHQLVILEDTLRVSHDARMKEFREKMEQEIQSLRHALGE